MRVRDYDKSEIPRARQNQKLATKPKPIRTNFHSGYIKSINIFPPLYYRHDTTIVHEAARTFTATDSKSPDTSIQPPPAISKVSYSSCS